MSNSSYSLIAKLNIRGLLVSESGETIDIYTMYRFLKCIYDKTSQGEREMTISDIAAMCDIGKNTAVIYAKIAEIYELINSRREGKKKLLKISVKGIEYLLAFERILSFFKK